MWKNIIIIKGWRIEIPAGKLKLNAVSERVWQYISIDFITKLLVSRDHDSILVICNRFSKMLYFITITEKIIAEELIRLFRNNV